MLQFNIFAETIIKFYFFYFGFFKEWEVQKNLIYLK